MCVFITAIQNAPSEESGQNAQSDLNLRWVQKSQRTFSDFAAHMNTTYIAVIIVLSTYRRTGL